MSRPHDPLPAHDPLPTPLPTPLPAHDPLPAPRDPSGPYRVCFVCLGNICRSPMAEVVARAQLKEAGLSEWVVVDSAGTGDWHVGGRMHQGSSRQLAKSGYDGSAHRARQFHPSWLAERDLVLAMDANNLATLRHWHGTGNDNRIRLFGDVAGLRGQDVPDPYGAGSAEFARVLAMIESGMANLVAQLRTLEGARR